MQDRDRFDTAERISGASLGLQAATVFGPGELHTDSTELGTSTVVKAVLAGLREVRGRCDPDITYVVSGRDVPLQPPKALFVSYTDHKRNVVKPFTSIITKAEAWVHDGGCTAGPAIGKFRTMRAAGPT